MRLERALDSIQRAINHKLDYARYLRQHPLVMPCDNSM